MCWARRSTCCASRRPAAACLGALLLAGAAGCTLLPPAGGPAGTGLGPVLQRMQRAYPDLQSGRFIVLADFETAAQAELLRTVRPDGSAAPDQPVVTILRSRNETGAGGLRARLADSDTRLLFDGQRSRELALVRDWRPWPLLLMSVYGPDEGVTLELTVTSGPPAALQWSRSVRIEPGWNLLRFDVATLGDRIDLADVRSIAWRAPHLDRGLDIYLDDILLVDNTRHVLGQEAGDGELFALTRGRRIVCGARGRFELELADGVIVAWREPGGDNLADVGGLGPWPVPLPEDWHARSAPPVAYDDPALFAGWGGLVATGQRIVEATPFRIVLEGRWRFGPDGPPAAGEAEPDDGRPGHTWQYVVYPTGQLHVRVSSSAPAGGWGAPRVGYALGLDGRRDFRRPPPAAAEPGAAPLDFVLLARAGPRRADLLWTWPRQGTLPRQRELVSTDERRLAVLAGDLEAAGRIETAHLLRVWPPDIEGPPEAASLAADYQYPVALRPVAGRLVTTAAGDLDGDGYNESEGCYELEPSGDVLRVDFDPGGRLRHDPVFRVRGTAQRPCWVYVRGRSVRLHGRDGAGDLLFRLGQATSTAALVEVHVGAGPAAP